MLVARDVSVCPIQAANKSRLVSFDCALERCPTLGFFEGSKWPNFVFNRYEYVTLQSRSGGYKKIKKN